MTWFNVQMSLPKINDKELVQEINAGHSHVILFMGKDQIPWANAFCFQSGAPVTLSHTPLLTGCVR